MIGGGIAGIQASLDLAGLGFKVYMVEKAPSIGGRVAQLHRLFPTLEDAMDILRPMMTEAYMHPKIELLTCSEIEAVSGKAGAFSARLLTRARYVDERRCTGCGRCASNCPVEVSNEFDVGLSKRKAIFIPFTWAIPPTYTIDGDQCLHFKEAMCRACERSCPENAVNYDQEPTEKKLEVGAIIVATGFDVYDAGEEKEYGYGVFSNVINGLEYERLCSPSGPTGGEPLQPFDRRGPRSVAFILCVGSRDETANPYCCRVGCSVALKHAYQLKSQYGDGAIAYVCFTDLRTNEKGGEEFSKRVRETGVKLIRGRPSEMLSTPDGRVAFNVYDTATSKLLRVEADLVVLETCLVQRREISRLQKILKIPLGSDGFFLEKHLKLNQAETSIDGVFLAGTAQGPKDITETVLHAHTAAMAAASLLVDFTSKRHEGCETV